MFVRMIRSSFLRRGRRRAVVLVAVALGTSAAAALADIALDVQDKMRRELEAFGANLVVLPAGGAAPVLVGGEDVSSLRPPSYLEASDLGKVRENFWKNNILQLAPELDVSARLRPAAAAGETGRAVLLRGAWLDRADTPAEPQRRTGLRSLDPYWSVAGEWPREDGTAGAAEAPAPDEALAGVDLAAALDLRPGDLLSLEIAGRPSTLRITGLLSAGGEEDGAVLLPIESLWRLSGLDGKLSRVLVRALTTPESAVYDRLGLNPRTLPPSEFERWTCTPFPSSVAFELSRAVPGSEARVIRRVADSEGTILRRLTALMGIMALLAGLGAALATTSALSTSVLERRSEIGLLKALGAGNPRVLGLFLSEAVILGLVGGALGAGLGAILARFISASVFGSPVAIPPLALPLAILLAMVITIAGSIVPARRVLGLRPAEVLRGL